MSTVDKKTADDIIAGKYPEDNCVAILRYENAFNGNYAYKLIFSRGLCTNTSLAKDVAFTALRINTGAPIKIYWTNPVIKLKETMLTEGYAVNTDFL